MQILKLNKNYQYSINLEEGQLNNINILHTLAGYRARDFESQEYTISYHSIQEQHGEVDIKFTE